jgi:hypothetical protein
LAAWYDASDPATVLTTVSPDVPASNGQTVRRWVSRHNPAVFWNQGDLVIQPKLNDPNPGINFNGTSQFMDGSATMASVFRNRGYGYIFAVAQDTNPTGGGSLHSVFHANTAAGATARVAIQTRATANIFRTVGRRLDADTAVILEGGANNGNLNLLEYQARWSAGELQLLANGASLVSGNYAASGNTSDTDSLSIVLGTDGDLGTRIFPGNIREIIICNEQLTAAQILNTRRYLQRKWSTPALP